MSIPKVSLLRNKLPVHELENLSGLSLEKSMNKSTYTFKNTKFSNNLTEAK